MFFPEEAALSFIQKSKRNKIKRTKLKSLAKDYRAIIKQLTYQLVELQHKDKVAAAVAADSYEIKNAKLCLIEAVYFLVNCEKNVLQGTETKYSYQKCLLRVKEDIVRSLCILV